MSDGAGMWAVLSRFDLTPGHRGHPFSMDVIELTLAKTTCP